MFIQTNQGTFVNPSRAATILFALPPAQAATLVYTDGSEYLIDGSQLKPLVMNQLREMVKGWVRLNPQYYFNLSLFSEIEIGADADGTQVMNCFVGETAPWRVTDGGMINTIWQTFERYSR